MLFSFWQLKTTVCIIILASSFGQELLRSCERDYCYERSIERRQTGPNDLQEWHLYKNKGLPIEELALLDRGKNQLDSNKRIYENGERHIDQNDLSQRHLTEACPETSNVSERQMRSDVTRNLVKSSGERRESQLNDPKGFRSADASLYKRQNADFSPDLLSVDEALRRSSNRYQKKSSDDNREEHQKLLERNAERDIRTHSKNKENQYRQNLRQISTRSLRRSSEHAREFQRVDEQRDLERKDHHRTLTRFDDRRVGIKNEQEKRERYEIFRRQDHDAYSINERDDIAARFDERDINRHSQRVVEGSVRKVRELKQRREGNNLKEDINRRSVDRDMERANSMRRDINRRIDEDEFENKLERINDFEISREFRDREGQRNNNREYSLRRVDESETQREINRHLEDGSQLIQRRILDKHERNERTLREVDYQLLSDSRNSRSIHERSDGRRGQYRYKNEQERRQHPKMSASFEDRVTKSYLSRHSDVIDESPSRTSQNVRQEYESVERRDKSNRNQHQRLETSKQFIDDEIQRNDYEHKEDGREITLQPLYDRERLNDGRNSKLIDERINYEGRAERRYDNDIQRDHLENKRENPNQTLRIFNDRSDDDYNLRGERSLKLHVDREAQHHPSRRELIMLTDYRKASNDVPKHEYRYQIVRKLHERELNQRSNDVREIHDPKGKIVKEERDLIPERAERFANLRRFDNRNSRDENSRHFRDNRESIRNDKRQMIDKQESQHTKQHIYQELRDSERSFILRQKGKNYNSMEEDYIPRTAVLLKDTYMALGQGAILAYIILKTLNGKPNSKNQLPINKLREAITCF